MEKEIEMAKEIAEEALKNAPIIHKTKQELKMEELEGRVSHLESAVTTLTQMNEDLRNKLNLKVDANKIISAINLSDEGTTTGADFKGSEYKPVRANNQYIEPKGRGVMTFTRKKPDLEKIANFKSVTMDWTLGSKIHAINEELHNVDDLETKMEFLILKSKLLEVASLGKVSCTRCSYDEYLDHLN